jgi:hypothetical protein
MGAKSAIKNYRVERSTNLQALPSPERLRTGRPNPKQAVMTEFPEFKKVQGH